MSLEPLRGGGSSLQSWQRPIGPVVNSMDEARRKIDEYDKSLPRTWAEATLPWAGRLVAGGLADRRFNLPENNRFYQRIPQRMIDLADGRMSYHDLLGIESYGIEKDPGISWKATLRNKEFQAAYSEIVRENFKNIHWPRVGLWGYLKNTVFKQNLGLMIDDLQQGRVCPLLGRCLGVLFFGWPVINNTRKQYQAGKAAEDGSIYSRLKTLAKTGLTFSKEAAKAVISWELGSLGFVLGTALFCVGTIPAIVAGCILGGLLEAGFRYALNGICRDCVSQS